MLRNEIPTDLKNATIFDLTSDKAIIEAFVGYLPDKAEYEGNTSPSAKACAMIDCAAHMQDDKLLLRLNEAFKDELAQWFNE